MALIVLYVSFLCVPCRSLVSAGLWEEVLGLSDDVQSSDQKDDKHVTGTSGQTLGTSRYFSGK